MKHTGKKIMGLFLLLFLGGPLMKAQYVPPNTQNAPGSPVPNVYDPLNPAGNYNTPVPNTTQPYPSNQSPNGQPDKGAIYNTDPMRPSSDSIRIQKTNPDFNNAKPIHPDNNGHLEPLRKDSLLLEKKWKK